MSEVSDCSRPQYEEEEDEGAVRSPRGQDPVIWRRSPDTQNVKILKTWEGASHEEPGKEMALTPRRERNPRLVSGSVLS